MILSYAEYNGHTLKKGCDGNKIWYPNDLKMQILSYYSAKWYVGVLWDTEHNNNTFTTNTVLEQI